jgi:hypothetical protein
MRKLACLAIALLLGGSAAGAQGRVLRPEFRPFAGVLIPTGDFRNEFKTAETFGGQLALEVTPVVHVVGSLGWTHGHSKLAVAVANDRTDVWQYDAGVELNPFGRPGTTWEFRPFIGFGAGARTNDYKAATLRTTTCFAGYGALGAELQRGFLAFRVEGRDYLSCQESPVDGLKKTRNDVRLNFGIALHLH